MDYDGKYKDAFTKFYHKNYRLWHIMSWGQEIRKENLCHQDVIDRCNLTPSEFGYILGEESVEGFRCRQPNNHSLVLESQRLVVICDSRACYVSYDDVSSQRFQDFINTAKAWVANGIPSDNVPVIRAALHLIYQDIQDQVDSRCSGRTLMNLCEKGSLLSSKSKKVMDDMFNPRCQVDGVQVVAYLGPKELREFKKLWDSIDVQLDDIRGLLNTKRRRLKTVMVWCAVLSAVCLLSGNAITAVRLAVDETRSSSSIMLCVFAFCICFVAIYFQFAFIRVSLAESSAIRED